MYNKDSKKTNAPETEGLSIGAGNCQICTGCGRCGKSASSMQVLDFYAMNLENRKREAAEGGEIRSQGIQNKPGKYLIAADIGTTTVAMQLRDAVSGEVIDSYTAVNPQRKYGADVLSRITQVNEYGKKEEMKKAAEEVLQAGILQFRRTLDGKQEKECSEIALLVIAANTTMVHLALGMDVSRLGAAPFEAETLEEIHTKMAGIDTVILPGCSAFIGGDMIAGMYACGMDERDELTLLIDLGTNGEIALGNREKIVAAATAAAPAFEGGTADGVWGADMVSVTAKLLEEGVMDETGLLCEPYFESGIRIAGLTMTQAQIRNIQMAKGAVYAGIQMLCREYGLQDKKRIAKVFLAGGFGYYLNSLAAVRIGLIPGELAGRVMAVGNSALEGAFLYGRSLLEGMGEERNLKRIQKITSVMNLAKQPEFQGCYLDALNFPAE